MPSREPDTPTVIPRNGHAGETIEEDLLAKYGDEFDDILRRHCQPLLVCDRDLEELRASGISDTTIRANGIYSITVGEALEGGAARMAELLHQLKRGFRRAPPDLLEEGCLVDPERGGGCTWPDFCNDGGLVYPYHDRDGQLIDYVRVKVRCPRVRGGKPIKYEAPKGLAPRLYVPAGMGRILQAEKEALCLTEGEKKALALVQAGVNAVALGGVWAWKKKDEEALIDDLADIDWKGRLVFICFDHDAKASTRHQVGQATRRLAALLRKAGARGAFIITLPIGPGSTKMGADDFLAAHGEDGPHQFGLLVEKAVPAPSLDEFTLRNFYEQKGNKEGGGKVKIGLHLNDIKASLDTMTDYWPRRVGDQLFAPDGDRPLWLGTPADLFAWASRYTDSPHQWARGTDKSSQEQFHAYLRQTVERYDAVETVPHEPPLAGHYYLHPEPTGGDGKALASLIARFSPASDADRSLLTSLILTLFWGGPPGSRPVFMLTGAEGDSKGGRGVGKSTVPEMLAPLAGGLFEVKPEDDFDRTLSRLLTPSSAHLRFGRVDNVKTLRLSWADFEGLVTSSEINGHRLFAGDARRPNTMTWCVTVNGASLSKDMSQRVVPVQLARPAYDARWKVDTEQLIKEGRWAVIGDVLSILRGPKKPLTTYSRWASWEGGVLACFDNAEECQRLIVERQGAVDCDDEAADIVRAAFVKAMEQAGHNPASEVVFFHAAAVADIVNAATKQKLDTTRASAYLGALSVAELRKGNLHGGHRGWRWIGPQSKAGDKAVVYQSQAEALCEDMRGTTP